MSNNQQTRRWCLRAIGSAVGSTAIINSASADEHLSRAEAELTDEAHGLATGASGRATFEVTVEEGTVAYELHIDRICNPTQAHIHLGGPNEDGPVVVWLYPEDVQEPRPIQGVFQGTLATGTITPEDFVGPLAGLSFEEAFAVYQKEDAYVNVHTVEHPGGEIRGQIRPVVPGDEPDDAEDEEDAPPADDDDEEEKGDSHGFRVETVAEGLTHPWGITFLPDKRQLLVTERNGGLQLIDRTGGSVQEIDGVPDVYAQGQGGLLDVTVHPDFPAESWVYLTYSAANDADESATHLGRGRLDRDEQALEEFEVLHIAEPFLDSNGHYGSRAVFGEDGALYVTTGDRQDKDFGEDHPSQDTTNTLGATLRFNPDGSIPDDNPFVDAEDAEDAIFSYGHRNAQGMTVHPETGDIWQSEHGEQDGDEINVIEAGGNYGWPIAHTGCHYGNDESVGDNPFDREDVVDPVYYWECNTGGFPPAGATFYNGAVFPNWRGDLFIANLAGQFLGRFTVNGRDVEEAESLLDDCGWRIRDVAVAPDRGHLYVVVDAADAPLVRLVPDRSTPPGQARTSR